MSSKPGRTRRVYLPEGFKTKRSLELGRLVSAAYDQFACFEDTVDWKLPERYELIRELRYSWRSMGSIDTSSTLEDYLRRLRSLGGTKKIEMPIGFIVERRNEVFVIFRGTRTVKEWINNLNTKFSTFFLDGFGTVHDGFLASYLNFREQITETIRNIAPSRKIHIAGHSLGAAFATFTACDIEISMKRRVSSMYTYGSPRVGDDVFAQAFNAVFSRKVFRVANTSDIVTEIPFPVPFAGIFGGYFTHVDTPVIFTTQCGDIEENHAMETYLAAIRSAAKKTFFPANIAKIVGMNSCL